MRTISLFTSAAFLACVGQQVQLSGVEEDAAAFREDLGDEYEDLVSVTNRILLAANYAVG